MFIPVIGSASSVLCSLRWPAALTLSACHCRTYLPRRLSSLMLGACSCRLSVRHFLCLCVGHYSGSSGVERAEFTPYPSEPIEKTYPIRMVKGVFSLRIVSVCVCVTIRTSGGAFHRLPITHRTNPAIAGTVIHPHGYHVPPCRLKADIRGSDQSAVHVLPRTLSISSALAWLWCMSTVNL